ncbi:hypothetical protein [Xanthomarina gelatinilytica]|uniref:hypothetical protein n=1 Tax=Xanthomarina gelatinilytica TaxID=1137281 RepID=UPI00351550A8
MNVFFKEEQRFSQWWLWLIIIGLGNIPVFGIYKQFVLGEAFGNNPMSDVGLMLFSAFIFGIIVLFWLMRLKTEINNDGVRVSFFPFVKKHFLWTDIKSARVIKYRFLGYGIRIGLTHGIVYNMKGNKGLSLELFNKKKYLIGTQKEEELHSVLDKLRNSNIIG